MTVTQLILCFVFLSIPCFTQSQDFDSAFQAVTGFPLKYFSRVNDKINSIDDKISKKTKKYLNKLERQEHRIRRAVHKIDSSASVFFSNAKEKYDEFSASIKSGNLIPDNIGSSPYNAYLDKLGTSLSFLDKIKTITDKVKESQKNLKQLQMKLLEAENVKEFIAERKQQISSLLAQYKKLPSAVVKQYQRLSKTTYYYSAQLKEYKEMLKDPKKIEEKVLSMLNKIPVFQKFMKENSGLSSLFRIPGNNAASSESLQGLQIRAAVNDFINRQVSIGGSNAITQVRQNLALAHAEINKLKDRINNLAAYSNDFDMPDFKPNDQKTKSFLKRLELGSNIQSQRSASYFPAVTDVGLSVGYKLNNKSVAGIGASYKLGFGRGWNNIHLTSEGIGFRAFVDYQIKKSFFVSGGYEQNYKSAFRSIEQLKNYNGWQTSGLIGISKKYTISKRYKGKIQLLWDFMSYKAIPKTPPIVYRLGYIIK